MYFQETIQWCSITW